LIKKAKEKAKENTKKVIQQVTKDEQKTKKENSSTSLDVKLQEKPQEKPQKKDSAKSKKKPQKPQEKPKEKPKEKPEEKPEEKPQDEASACGGPLEGKKIRVINEEAGVLFFAAEGMCKKHNLSTNKVHIELQNNAQTCHVQAEYVVEHTFKQKKQFPGLQ
jgi:hypothetical protein